MGNSHLSSVRVRNGRNKQDDEFYTRYEDVAAEFNQLHKENPDFLRGKKVLLPCDDPQYSAFTKYFVDNFYRFGLEKLTSTSYSGESTEAGLFDTETPRGRIFTMRPGDIVDSNNIPYTNLVGNGSFDTGEVTAIALESDAIFTNPPFSAINKRFHPWLRYTGCEYAYIAPITAPILKEVVTDIVDGKTWAGTHNPNTFNRADGTQAQVACLWLTNIDNTKRHKPLEMQTTADIKKTALYKKYAPQGALQPAIPMCGRPQGVRGRVNGEIRKFAAGGFINLPKESEVTWIPSVNLIPSDHKGRMAVPVTFLSKWCPEQHRIVCRAGYYQDALTAPGMQHDKVCWFNQNGDMLFGGFIIEAL